MSPSFHINIGKCIFFLGEKSNKHLISKTHSDCTTGGKFPASPQCFTINQRAEAISTCSDKASTALHLFLLFLPPAKGISAVLQLTTTHSRAVWLHQRSDAYWQVLTAFPFSLPLAMLCSSSGRLPAMVFTLSSRPAPFGDWMPSCHLRKGPLQRYKAGRGEGVFIVCFTQNPVCIPLNNYPACNDNYLGSRQELRSEETVKY